MEWTVLKELKEKVMTLPWMDDLVQVVRGTLSRQARWAVRRQTRVKAYGDALSFLMTAGEEAFGFTWRVRDGVVYVKQDEKWVDRNERWEPDKPGLPSRVSS